MNDSSDFFGIQSDTKNIKHSQYFGETDPFTSDFIIPKKTKQLKLENQANLKLPQTKVLKPATLKINSDQVPKAYEVAMKIRKQMAGREDAAKDSKGFRTMQGQTPIWNSLTRLEKFQMLRKSIIYNNQNGIVAFNKPYGISSHTGPVAFTDFFPTLQDWLKKQNKMVKKHGEEVVEEEEEELWLRLVHRLDRDTTGVFVVATKQDVAAKLRYWFNERMVKKTYLAVTKFVPKDSEGIIDIPIYEFQLASKFSLSSEYNLNR